MQYEEFYLTKFFQPRLQSLEITPGSMGWRNFNYLSYDLLQHIRDQCPKLWELKVMFPHTAEDAHMLAMFLWSVPALESLVLGSWTARWDCLRCGVCDFCRYEHAQNNRAMEHLLPRLASLPHLRKLELGATVSGEYLCQMQRRDPAPFGSLRELECSTDDDGIRSLLTPLRNLEKLRLKHWGSGIKRRSTGHCDEIISPSLFGLSVSCIIQLSCLRSLRLNIPDSHSLHGSHLDILSLRCPLLEELCVAHLSGRLICRLGSGSWTLRNTDIEVMAHRLPQLRLLSIRQSSALLGVGSLISLGQHCRKLRVCELGGAFDFSLFVIHFRAPLFPELEMLRLESLQKRIPAEPDLLFQAHYLGLHAPRMRRRGCGLAFDRKGQLEEDMVRSFEALESRRLSNALHCRTSIETGEAVVL